MAVTIANYNKKYLRMTPAVTQIYDDLDKYRDWVRMQHPAVPFNEGDLYNMKSPLWQKYIKHNKRAPQSNAQAKRS